MRANAESLFYRSAAGLLALACALCSVRAAEDDLSQGAEIQTAEQEEENIHAKLITNDAPTSGKGHVSFEFYYDYERSRRSFDNGRNTQRREKTETHEPFAGLYVGVTDDLDVFTIAGYVDTRDPDFDFDPDDNRQGPHRGSALADTQVGIQWGFFKKKELALELAYVCAVTTPSGTDTTRRHLGTSEEFFSCDQSILALKDWGKWTANAEVTYLLPFGPKRGEARGTLVTNLAAGYQWRTWLQPEVELNYHRSFVRKGSGSDRLASTVGLLFGCSENIAVGVGVQQAWAGRNEDRNTTLLFTIRTWW